MQYSSGTRGFLEWTRDHLPWVYTEYAKRDVSGTSGGGLSGFSYADAGMRHYGGGLLGLIGDDPTTEDISVDTVDVSPSVAAAVSDPASSAAASPTSSSQAGIFSQLASAVSGFLLTQNQLQTQNKIVNVQLQRAQQGLPPLNINTLQAGLPNPTVNIGLSSQTSQLVMYALLGVGALFVLPQLFKGAR
jgi:hypothetical protein